MVDSQYAPDWLTLPLTLMVRERLLVGGGGKRGRGEGDEEGSGYRIYSGLRRMYCMFFSFSQGQTGRGERREGGGEETLL